MSDFAKLTEAYCQVEGAADVLRDLLSPANADRMALAMHEACIADEEEMGRTLRFLDWLLAGGEDHLDGMLVELYHIAPEAIENERRLRAEAFQNQGVRERALANHQKRATRWAQLQTEITRAKLARIQAHAAQLKAEVDLRHGEAVE